MLAQDHCDSRWTLLSRTLERCWIGETSSPYLCEDIVVPWEEINISADGVYLVSMIFYGFFFGFHVVGGGCPGWYDGILCFVILGILKGPLSLGNSPSLWCQREVISSVLDQFFPSISSFCTQAIHELFVDSVCRDFLIRYLVFKCFDGVEDLFKPWSCHQPDLPLSIAYLELDGGSLFLVKGRLVINAKAVFVDCHHLVNSF